MSPVRKIRPNYRSVTGRVGLGEGRPPGEFESTLERDFLLLLSFDPAADEIEPQPFRVDWVDEEGKKRRAYPDVRFRLRPLTYADCRRAPFLRSETNVVCQIKYRAELHRRWKELRPGLIACRDACRDTGWVFRVYTDRHIRTPFLRNVIRLKPRQKDRDAPEAARRIVEALQASGRVSMAQLLASAARDDPERRRIQQQVWRLLAWGEIQTDFATEIQMHTPLWLRNLGARG